MRTAREKTRQVSGIEPECRLVHKSCG